MVFLAISVAVFVAVHMIPAFPKFKARLKHRLGTSYGAFFGTAATITFSSMIYGWSVSGFEPVYEPPTWGHDFNLVMGFFALMVLSIFFFKGRLHKAIRFPFAVADIIWATGHLTANGDMAAIILFGGLLLFGVLYIWVARKNGIYPEFEVNKKHDLISIIVGVLAYVSMLFLHPILIGVELIHFG